MPSSPFALLTEHHRIGASRVRKHSSSLRVPLRGTGWLFPLTTPFCLRDRALCCREAVAAPYECCITRTHAHLLFCTSTPVLVLDEVMRVSTRTSICLCL